MEIKKRVRIIRIQSGGTNTKQDKVNNEIKKLEEHKCKIINVVIGGEYDNGLYVLIFYEVKRKNEHNNK